MSQNGSMQRTSPSGENAAKLQSLSALISRLDLARKLGLSHGGERDIYNTLGYPLKLKSQDLITQWERQDIARAVVDRPVKKTWSGDILISEPDQEEETELEKKFKELDDDLGLKSKLMRVDRLAQLGKYAVLLLGFDDSSKETWPQAVEGGERKLMYVRPVSKENAEVNSYENDPSHPRFGKPRTYNIDLEEPEGNVADGNKTKTRTLTVHHSRIIHVAFDLLEDEVEGVPIMESIYNRLKDIEKLSGGSAEMFWRGARPGYFAGAKEDYKVDEDSEKKLREQIDEYEHDLRRFLIAEGVDIESLAQQIADPKGHLDIQIMLISAATGIPARILVGSERGELASSQDQQNWKEFIQHRRTEEVEPTILRPFVDRLIEYGVLPEPGSEGYSVVWSDLFTLGEKEKADVGQSRAEALSKYVGQPAAESVVPLKAFLTYFLRMDEDQVTQILELRKEELEDMLGEEASLEEVARRLAEERSGQQEEEEVPNGN